MAQMQETWQLQEAKARLSEVIRRAVREGPQEITVHGQQAAVVLGAAEYQRLTRTKPSFLEFMRASPLVGVELELEREDSLTREVAL